MRRGRVISLLVAVGVVMSCIFDTPYEGACSDLNITLEFPASMATKSDVGQVPASDAENAADADKAARVHTESGRPDRALQGRQADHAGQQRDHHHARAGQSG